MGKNVGRALFFVITILFLILFFAMHRDSEYLERPVKLSVVGTVKDENGSRVLEGHFSKDAKKGDPLMLYLFNIDAEIYINGKSIFFSKSTEDVRWEKVKSPGIDTSDHVMIILRSLRKTELKSAYELFADNMYVGSEYGHLFLEVKENFYKIFVSILIFIIGCVLLVDVAVMRFYQVNLTRGYYSCGLIMLAGAVCTFIDYKYITLLVPFNGIVQMLDTLTQLLIVLFIMMYLRNYLQSKKYIHLISSLIGIWIGVVVCYYGVTISGHEMTALAQTFFAFMAAAFVGLSLFMLQSDYRRYRDQKTGFVLVSGIVLAVFTVVELIFFVYEGYFMIYLFQFGLLLFTIVQAYVLINYTRRQIIKANEVKRLELENAKQRMERKAIEAELEKNRMAVMISQLKPHFIYNALGTVGALCLSDAEKARQVTDHFSRYLRANMDSLNQKENIPFLDELNHTKNYLFVEQVRFGENLEVEYHIEVDDFKCPALTLQTMVENAVIHGIRKRKGKGTLRISTWEDANDVFVSVEDDGVGFDVQQSFSDERSHLGILNTKTRLEVMCHGALRIESEIGVGTKITIVIPKGSEDK